MTLFTWLLSCNHPRACFVDCELLSPSQRWTQLKRPVSVEGWALIVELGSEEFLTLHSPEQKSNIFWLFSLGLWINGNKVVIMGLWNAWHSISRITFFSIWYKTQKLKCFKYFFKLIYVFVLLLRWHICFTLELTYWWSNSLNSAFCCRKPSVSVRRVDLLCRTSLGIGSTGGSHTFYSCSTKL